MNSTKKMTQGAMLLALVGAFMVANRYFMGLYFDEFTFLLQTLILIVYGVSFGRREALMLSFGIVVLTVLFGGNISWMYCPLALLSGNFYVAGVTRGWGSKRLFFMTASLLVIGEVAMTFLIMPLFGLDWQQSLNGVQQLFRDLAGEEALRVLSVASVSRFLFIFAVIFTGLIEAMLIHLLSVYLLRRFKIKEVGVTPLAEMVIPPWHAYAALLCASLLFFVGNRLEESLLFTLLSSMAMIGIIYLIVLGFLFLLIWGKLRLKRNIAVYALLLTVVIPYLAAVILLLGFLYGSGPLRRYTDKIRGAL